MTKKHHDDSLELLLPFSDAIETDDKPEAPKAEEAQPPTPEEDASDTKPKRHRGRPMARQRVKSAQNPPYLKVLNPKTTERLAKEIIRVLMIERAYHDKDFTARELAKRLNTNTRYISITMSERFHMNFSAFVNKLRVEEAMTLLGDPRCEEANIQEIADLVGFGNRQSFCSYFLKISGVTAKAYRESLHGKSEGE